MIFQVLFSLVSIAIVGLVGWRIVVAYKASAGSLWQRLLAAGHGSATILWSYAVMAASAFIGNVDKIAGALNLPEAQGLIQKLPPQDLAAALIVVSVVTLIARLRTL